MSRSTQVLEYNPHAQSIFMYENRRENYYTQNIAQKIENLGLQKCARDSKHKVLTNETRIEKR